MGKFHYQRIPDTTLDHDQSVLVVMLADTIPGVLYLRYMPSVVHTSLRCPLTPPYLCYTASGVCGVVYGLCLSFQPGHVECNCVYVRMLESLLTWCGTAFIPYFILTTWGVCVCVYALGVYTTSQEVVCVCACVCAFVCACVISCRLWLCLELAVTSSPTVSRYWSIGLPRRCDIKGATQTDPLS